MSALTPEMATSNLDMPRAAQPPVGGEDPSQTLARRGGAAQTPVRRGDSDQTPVRRKGSAQTPARRGNSAQTPLRGENSAQTPARRGGSAQTLDMVIDSGPGLDVVEDPNVEEDDRHNKTVHTNPQWKDLLRGQFREIIVDKCSEATRNAFDGNVDIEVCN